jgi:hypothetical protein
MREAVAVTLFVASLIFFVRNLQTMDEVAALAKRVQRKLYLLAGELQLVMELNNEVKVQLSTIKEVEIEESPEEPPLEADKGFFRPRQGGYGD